jgi:hypothetical protein
MRCGPICRTYLSLFLSGKLRDAVLVDLAVQHGYCKFDLTACRGIQDCLNILENVLNTNDKSMESQKTGLFNPCSTLYYVQMGGYECLESCIIYEKLIL